MSPDERAKKVAKAIANIGKPSYRPQQQPVRQPDGDAEIQHQLAQAKRFK